MDFKQFLIFAIIAGIASGIAIHSGQCPQNIGLPNRSFISYNTGFWNEFYETDRPNTKCMLGKFHTDTDGGQTMMYRTFIDKSNSAAGSQTGYLMYNVANGGFSVNLTNYPANGQYWLVDQTTMASTFAVCIPLSNTSYGMSGWVIINDMSYANNPFIIPEAKAVLQQYGVDVADLLPVDNSDCINWASFVSQYGYD